MCDERKKYRGDRFIHQQRLHRVANGRALALCVHDDFLGHLQVGVGVHIDVANAFVMFDDGHLRAFGHRSNQSLTAARHAKINVLGEGEQLTYGLAVGCRYDLDGARGEVPGTRAEVHAAAPGGRSRGGSPMLLFQQIGQRKSSKTERRLLQEIPAADRVGCGPTNGPRRFGAG